MWKKNTYIDLTHSINEEVVTWEGTSGFSHEVILDYNDGACVMKYCMEGGIGTHMDAPSHFFSNKKNIGDIDINDMIAPLYVIDVAEKIEPNGFISREDIEVFEEKYGRIQKGSVVVGCTGWERFWYSPDKYRNIDDKGNMTFPGFDIEAVKILLSRGVSGIGIDTLSIDGANKEFLSHKMILSNNK